MADRRKNNGFGGGAVAQPYYSTGAMSAAEHALSDWRANQPPGAQPPQELLDAILASPGTGMTASIGDPFQRMAANAMGARRGSKAPQNTMFGMMGMGGGLGGLFG